MRILVVSDGRRGIENQALGLAEAVARMRVGGTDIVTHTLKPSLKFAALPPSLQLIGKRDFGLPGGADMIIGCGRQAVAPLIATQRQDRPPFTVFVQDPRVDPSRFDLVVAPDHDELSGPFVQTMIGSPNRVTQTRIISETLKFSNDLTRFPMPRATFLIGGPSKTHALDEASLGNHLEAARTLIEQGYSLLVTLSRRTPDDARDVWETLVSQHENTWLHSPDSYAPNPYFAFLGGADLILVTEDSTNMLTEACATGKPVFRLPMAGRPGKFQTLYDALETRCHVTRWTPEVTLRDYEPLMETDRIAQRVLERYSAARQPSSP